MKTVRFNPSVLRPLPDKAIILVEHRTNDRMTILYGMPDTTNKAAWVSPTFPAPPHPPRRAWLLDNGLWWGERITLSEGLEWWRFAPPLEDPDPT